MFHYILRRLILLPLTLLCIVIVNFIIINLAPGDPTTVTEISPEGMASRKEDQSISFGADDRYLQFREHYGLTLPILINWWPFTSEKSVREALWSLSYRRNDPADAEEMNAKQFNALRLKFGDKSRYVMPQLLKVIEDPQEDPRVRKMAVRFFVRGGTRQAFLGANLSDARRAYNQRIAKGNDFLYQFLGSHNQSLEEISVELRAWFEKNKSADRLDPDFLEKVQMMGQTRLIRYLSRVLTLDFGTLRNDSTKTVVEEVVKRFRYSLTLSLLPMILTFFLSQLFGLWMAYKQDQWQDLSLNVFFLILYAVPIFVVAPFLIEKVALNHYFPFTRIPIPINGFTSPDNVYNEMTSMQRLLDILQHIALPLTAIMYGTLAASSRLSRTAFLEVMRQDYIRTARAKGVSEPAVMVKHAGRNAGITILTSLAGSLGVVLGGSLIVETLFEINGFGKFFYDAVINRDYNVTMFSALAGAFLTLMGYLIADIAYTILDPRVTLE